MHTLNPSVADRACSANPLSRLLPLACLVLLTATTIILSRPASAASITLGDFSGTETVETFSSLTTNGEFLTSLNGVTYNSLAGGNLTVATNGYDSFFDNIPGASLSPTVYDVVATSNFTIDFSTQVNRVGLLLSTSAITTWTVSALDSSLTLLDSVTVSMPAIGNAVFAGLEFLTTDIFRLQITELTDGGMGAVSIFDDVRYEAVVPVPTAFWLFSSGLLGLIGIARRKKV